MNGGSSSVHPSAACPTPDLPRVEIRSAGKAFGSTKVLQEVDLTVMPGDIVGLVGQNGAGKSTLMKILGGVYPDHDGTISIDSVVRQLSSPRAALHAGIGMIHQELSLVSSMTVAENILLGMEPGSVRYSRKRLFAKAARLTRDLAVMRDIRLDALVGDLGAGMQQRVEIAKALSRDVSVLVLDEPTARLPARDRAELLKIVRETAQSGIGVIYISHFLEEVFEVATKVTVLRNGCVVASGPTSDFSMRSLTTAMLSAELIRAEHTARPALPAFAETLMRVRGLSCGARLREIDLQVRAGEIVGLTGLVGSGRSRLLRVLAGAEPFSAGTIEVRGRPYKPRSPREALRNGVALLPEDRKADGLIGVGSAAANLQLMALDAGLSRAGMVRRKQGRRLVAQALVDYEVRPPDARKLGELFSGGNQQKLLIARALMASPTILLADQPTIGVDVGTKVMIHRILRDAAENGIGIVIASDDLEELIAVSDRVLVMRNGEVIAEHSHVDLSRELLIEQMSEGVRSAMPVPDADS